MGIRFGSVRSLEKQRMRRQLRSKYKLVASRSALKSVRDGHEHHEHNHNTEPIK